MQRRAIPQKQIASVLTGLLVVVLAHKCILATMTVKLISENVLLRHLILPQVSGLLRESDCVLHTMVFKLRGQLLLLTLGMQKVVHILTDITNRNGIWLISMVMFCSTFLTCCADTMKIVFIHLFLMQELVWLCHGQNLVRRIWV